jgi:hypothetical protein
VARELAANAPEPAAYGQLPGVPAPPLVEREGGRLPLPERPTRIDPSIDLHLPDAPGYDRLLAWTHQTVGAGAGDFLGFRLRVRYPAMPSVLSLRYSLPPAN